MNTKQQTEATSTKTYSLTVDPMAHRNGWDVFGDQIAVRTLSSGIRVTGGERVVLRITADAAGHEHVESVFEADDSVNEYTVRA